MLIFNTPVMASSASADMHFTLLFSVYDLLCLLFLTQEDDRKLLKEIGKNGEGRPDEVQQLIDEVLIVI